MHCSVLSGLTPIVVIGIVAPVWPELATARSCGGSAAQPVSLMRCCEDDICALSDKTNVRLAGIDAPAAKGTMGGKGQQGSDVAAATLRERLVGKPGFTMSVHDRDRYGRTVGEFCIDGKSVNVEIGVSRPFDC